MHTIDGILLANQSAKHTIPTQMVKRATQRAMSSRVAAITFPITLNAKNIYIYKPALQIVPKIAEKRSSPQTQPEP